MLARPRPCTSQREHPGSSSRRAASAARQLAVAVEARACRDQVVAPGTLVESIRGKGGPGSLDWDTELEGDVLIETTQQVWPASLAAACTQESLYAAATGEAIQLLEGRKRSHAEASSSSSGSNGSSNGSGNGVGSNSVRGDRRLRYGSTAVAAPPASALLAADGSLAAGAPVLAATLTQRTADDLPLAATAFGADLHVVPPARLTHPADHHLANGRSVPLAPPATEASSRLTAAAEQALDRRPAPAPPSAAVKMPKKQRKLGWMLSNLEAVFAVPLKSADVTEQVQQAQQQQVQQQQLAEQLPEQQLLEQWGHQRGGQQGQGQRQRLFSGQQPGQQVGQDQRQHQGQQQEQVQGLQQEQQQKQQRRWRRQRLRLLQHSTAPGLPRLAAATADGPRAAPRQQQREQQQQQQQQQPQRQAQLPSQQPPSQPPQGQWQQASTSLAASKCRRAPPPALPTVSDAELWHSIASAPSSAALVRLYQQHQQRMRVWHTAAMMLRLAALVEASASHRQVMSDSEGRLWIRLREKALLTITTASMRQCADVLSALHRVAAAREQHHLGWVRARAPAAAAAAVAAPALARVGPEVAVSGSQRQKQQLRRREGMQQGEGGLSSDQGGGPERSDQLMSEVQAGEWGLASGDATAAVGAALGPEASQQRRASGEVGVETAAGPAGEGAGLDSGSRVGNVHGGISGGTSGNVSASGRSSVAPPCGYSYSLHPPPVPPLHSSRSLLPYERDLVDEVLEHSAALMATAPSEEGAPGGVQQQQQQQQPSLRELLGLVSALGRLGGYAPGDAWQAAFFAATLPHLPRLTLPELVSLAVSVSKLQQARRPPAAWLQAFYSRSRGLLPFMDPRELSAVLAAAARLPPPHPESWVDAAVRRAADLLDALDAPAFALLVHALARMRQRSLRPWVQELLESSMSLLYDFSPEELSLVLRGCSMLRVTPDADWFHEFFSRSQPRLRTASGPQLVNMGWALAQMRVMPPRAWAHEWLLQLRRRLHAGGRPLGLGKGRWHGIGYAVHAKRAVYAVAAFRPAELEDWCKWLRTPAPRPRPALKGAGAAPGSDGARDALPPPLSIAEQSFEQDFLGGRPLFEEEADATL